MDNQELKIKFEENKKVKNLFVIYSFAILLIICLSKIGKFVIL